MRHVLMLPSCYSIHCFVSCHPPLHPSHQTDQLTVNHVWVGAAVLNDVAPVLISVLALGRHLHHTTSFTPLPLRRKEGTVERKAVEGEQTATGMQKER